MELKLTDSKIWIGLLALLCGLALAHSETVPAEARAERTCGKIKRVDPEARIHSKGISCGKARRILNYWMNLGPGVKEHPDNSGGHWTLRRYPGWVCSQGAGAGGCFRGGREATYSVFG